MDEQPVLRRPVAQPGEGGRRRVERPCAAEHVDRVERARTDRVGDAEQFPLGEAEDPLLVELGRNADVRRAWEPPPGGIELGHRHAVIGQEQADVLITQPFVARCLVVAPPERQTAEAAGLGGSQPFPEGGARPEGARAQHGVGCSEGHRFVQTQRNGLAGAAHRGRRVLVTIVPFVFENGTGAHENAAARV